jgi:hypothetical protein
MRLYPGPVAVLYQAALPPPVDGIQKPMKPGGYSDGGADIAFNLQAQGVSVVTHRTPPDPTQALDWVFPDTAGGIRQARRKGAQILWANTILFARHPLEALRGSGLRVIGQNPARVQEFDDKWVTNELLRTNGCPLPAAILVGLRPEPGILLPDELTEAKLAEHQLSLPVVVKPVRGRGSEGVLVVHTLAELTEAARSLLSATVVVGELPRPKFGDRIIVEQFLPGTELTVTVLPPGIYQLPDGERSFEQHWCLPPVRRFNHHQDVAPYNGLIAVTQNSEVLNPEARAHPAVQALEAQCVTAAALVDAVAPIRIDARSTTEGVLQLFDLNLKPNLTGAGRPGRDDQDSLTTMAARELGWSYGDLLINMLRQAWEL